MMDNDTNDTQNSEEPAKGKEIAEYESAINHESASFIQLVETYYMRLARFNSKEENRLINAYYYPKLLEAFEKEHGQMEKFYPSPSKAFWAVVLTKKGKLFHSEGTTDQSALEFLYQCDKITFEAQRLLEGKDLKTCMEMLYDLITHLIGHIENQTDETSDEEKNDLIQFLTRELVSVNQYFIRAANRRALLVYFYGMLFGFVSLAIMFPVLCMILSYANVCGLEYKAAVGSFVFGGVGAMISVMTRMSSGKLILNYEAGPTQLRRLGFFRPIIGAVMGTMIYALVMSGKLPFTVPEDETAKFYFYISVAFIAGFTERWAQDMFNLAKSQTIENIEEKSDNAQTS